MEEKTLRCDEDGEAHLDHNSVLILSRGNLPYLQREFESIIGPTAHSIIYSSGKDFAGAVESNLREKIIHLWSKVSSRKVAERMLKQFRQWGYGKAEIIEFDESEPRIKLKVENSANADGYSESDEPVCHFTRGILAGAVSVLFDQDMDCVENKCIAQGDEYCEFEIMSAENYSEQSIRVE